MEDNRNLISEMMKVKDELDGIRRTLNFKSAQKDPDIVKSIFDSNRMLSYAADYLDLLARLLEHENNNQ